MISSRVSHMWGVLRMAMLGVVSIHCIGQCVESTPVYLQAVAQEQSRVEDLLLRMNAREKLAQIVGVYTPGPADRFTPEWMKRKLSDGAGFIVPMTVLGVDDDITSRTRIREFLRKQTRLGIPALFIDEAAHGYMRREATSFPGPIGLACSWNETLIERLYDMAAREARSRGTQHVLAPVIDVALDPRWGRTEETLGEDPYLNGRLGTAIVKGLQGGSSGEVDKNHVLVTLKHLTGHGAPEGGRNQESAHVGPIELRETHITPFAMVIRDAKPAAIMPSYNDVDGIPSHANRPILIDMVRGGFGFEGLFISDFGGVEKLALTDRVVISKATAARLALESGVQVELPQSTTFSELEPLIGTDPALESLVDNAVRAVLRFKFRLGLFEEAVALDGGVAHKLASSPESRELALQAARESIVLLKNEGDLLPLRLDRYKRIAIIGPNGDVARLGGYSGIPFKTVSLLEGMRERVGERAEVVFAEGCRISRGDNKNERVSKSKGAPADPDEDRHLIAEAKAVAEKADLVILALGENEAVGRETLHKGAPGDRASLDLVGAQTELAHTILATGKPVVLYLSNGRPISLGELATRIPAIVEGWYAGQETGRAATEILLGDTNPSGKLTISFPQSVGHIPANYRKRRSPDYPYLNSETRPLYPFGHGLSYTKFEYSNVRVSKPHISRDEGVRVTVDLANTGGRAGVEIAQLYVSDEVSSVVRPVMELRGFQRVFLQLGEKRTVSFEIRPDDLAFYNRELQRVVEPGWFTVMVGGSSAETQKVRFEVK